MTYAAVPDLLERARATLAGRGLQGAALPLTRVYILLAKRKGGDAPGPAEGRR